MTLLQCIPVVKLEIKIGVADSNRPHSSFRPIHLHLLAFKTIVDDAPSVDGSGGVPNRSPRPPEMERLHECGG